MRPWRPSNPGPPRPPRSSSCGKRSPRPWPRPPPAASGPRVAAATGLPVSTNVRAGRAARRRPAANGSSRGSTPRATRRSTSCRLSGSAKNATTLAAMVGPTPRSAAARPRPPLREPAATRSGRPAAWRPSLPRGGCQAPPARATAAAAVPPRAAPAGWRRTSRPTRAARPAPPSPGPTGTPDRSPGRPPAAARRAACPGPRCRARPGSRSAPDVPAAPPGRRDSGIAPRPRPPHGPPRCRRPGRRPA